MLGQLRRIFSPASARMVETDRALRCQKSGGFSLAESLVGMVILATVVSVYLTSMQVGFRSTQQQMQADVAITILDSVTEELLMLPSTDADLTMGSHERLYDRTGLRTTTAAFYTLQWEIAPMATDSSIRTIAMKARWIQGNTPRQISWSTCRN